MVLTVGLLEAGARATPTKLLWLASARVGDEQGAIIADEYVLDFLLRLLVNVLLVVGDEGLGDALADGVDLRGLAAAADADADVDTREALPPEKEDGLEGLETKDLRLHQLDWHAVHLDQSTPALAVRHSHGRFLPAKALHGLRRRRRHGRRSSSEVERDQDETLRLRIVPYIVDRSAQAGFFRSDQIKESTGDEHFTFSPHKPDPKHSETITAIPLDKSGKNISSKERKAGRVPSIVFEQEDGQHGGNKRLISVQMKQIRKLVDHLGRSFFLSRLFEQLGLGTRIRNVSSPHPVPCLESASFNKERSSSATKGKQDGQSYKLIGSSVKTIACGGRHSAVVTDTGVLLTFGWGLYGQEKNDVKLEKVLKEAAMENKTVILTTLNAAWASPGSIIDLFFQSFRTGDGTRRLLDHLVIIALDKKAYIRCISLHTHCFALYTEGMDFSDEKIYMTAGYLSMMWRRIEFLRVILEMGYNFIFSVKFSFL
ncbi:hypothetical protein ZIOFF_063782 [Zingiber officinale]|uniref:Nucleotide-diphospho-sugar transferase domain-containing protein n=1 Tax=Zingiber officinale TaxID=94328 RepID=A0A8J5F6S0_ZINOF|nr:hypothetical protein ZIOFF_063782 [Zingiber officinale]